MFSSLIKQKALQLGFEACGICKAEFTNEHAEYLHQWLDKGYYGEMSYMNRNVEVRSDSSLLIENAKSVIVVALNYFPEKKQHPDAPQFAYHAYGKDYHLVVKEKLQQLYNYIQELFPVDGRIFCDTAPLLEKYHAQKAGLGWIGKNTQLIIPGKGSFFSLGAIVLNRELDYDTPQENRCGNCRKCVDACPTQALVAPGLLNATRCISYLSIENKSMLGKPLSNNQIYGCDICNKACPHNQQAKATMVEEFKPSDAFLNLDKEQILQMNEDTFNDIFKESGVKRIGLKGLLKNL
ncbi:MAG: tRNA epoxyqueuosine(34) reductase QueG [Dysgonamonadaceae bacterium]|jgi:epoxyqueuosine reductase|nr:tRNA epoxyqueuosine(34) reductase QueG [Dysgonamonadaceae bacterium]